jgi:hypothetical protein
MSSEDAPMEKAEYVLLIFFIFLYIAISISCLRNLAPEYVVLIGILYSCWAVSALNNPVGTDTGTDTGTGNVRIGPFFGITAGVVFVTVGLVRSRPRMLYDRYCVRPQSAQARNHEGRYAGIQQEGAIDEESPTAEPEEAEVELTLGSIIT